MDNSKESKQLKEDPRGAMYIKDAAEIEVKSTEEALELMLRAQKRRYVASTDLNAESSRSHSIFTIRVVQAAYDPTAEDFNPRVGFYKLTCVFLYVFCLSSVLNIFWVLY